MAARWFRSSGQERPDAAARGRRPVADGEVATAPEAMAPERPVLSLPPDEADWLRERYAGAGVILEYGSGGSTLVAAEMPGKTVFSVESDLNWARRMDAWFASHPPAASVNLHPVNIGRTKEWGSPVDEAGWRNYHLYPVSVWDREDFRAPDLVLIDGRFRAACLLTVMLRTEAPVTVLFDDYADRPPYHVVERWIEPVERRGRMVRFEVAPWTLPPRDLATVLALFGKKN